MELALVEQSRFYENPGYGYDDRRGAPIAAYDRRAGAYGSRPGVPPYEDPFGRPGYPGAPYVKDERDFGRPSAPTWGAPPLHRPATGPAYFPGPTTAPTPGFYPSHPFTGAPAYSATPFSTSPGLDRALPPSPYDSHARLAPSYGGGLGRGPPRGPGYGGMLAYESGYAPEPRSSFTYKGEFGNDSKASWDAKPRDGWDQRDRRGSYNAPLLDFPADPDVRGFEDYKKRWDDIAAASDVKSKRSTAEGWGPEPDIKYNPLLMWSPAVEPSNTEPERHWKDELTPGIELKGSSFPTSPTDGGLNGWNSAARGSYDVTNLRMSPAAYAHGSMPVSAELMPAIIGPIGTHGRAGMNERERSLSPVRRPMRSEYEPIGSGRYKREDRFDY
ncbi:hypothetical protein HDU85_006240 [Gaertneriomyces sp. JEL0708]|nr:hypothetical protein HDU85_006240 [Gaertneriomyces sp. JEL0708]